MKAGITSFLGRTGGRNSSLWYGRPGQPRPSSSTSAQRVAHSFLLLPVLFILVVDSSSAQTKSKSTASLIYERCHSSVVVVYPLDKDSKPLGQGSGFIIAPNRVVTNHHVLADAAGAAVSFADGGTAVVEGFLADNPTRDIAIVSVKTGTRAPLKLGDELSVKQGDDVYAIGAPRGLDLSITNGIISGFRTIEDKFLLQTTAAIAPGSSGGPLFDRDGGVIGVTTSLLSDSPGIYFSVGIGDVARIMRSASAIVVPFSSLPGSGTVDQNVANEALAEATSWIRNTYKSNTGALFCTDARGGTLLAKNRGNWPPDKDCFCADYTPIFKGCAALINVFTEHVDRQDQVTDETMWQIRFNLRDIDPLSVKSTPTTDSNFVSPAAVDARTTNDADAMTFTTRDKEGPKISLHSLSGMGGYVYTGAGLVMDSDYAPRFIKAFRTAVESCGGKPSAF